MNDFDQLAADATALHAEAERLRDENARLRLALDRLISAYITPASPPARRYRAALPLDFYKWTDDLDEARAAILRAAGIEAGGID